IGLSELAYRDYGALEGRSYIAEIKKAGSNLLGLINDILDFSKIESGKFTIVVAPYQINSLLADILAMASIRLQEKPLLFLTDFDDNLPRALLGDEKSIRQVLLNLLSNAIKYTKNGYIKLSVKSRPLDDKHVILKFIVQDTGIGIKKEDLPNLFGDFVRLQDRRENRYVEGTGLGLSIAKSLSNMMGGDIAVESRLGVGSVFTATFLQGIEDLRPLDAVSQVAAESQSSRSGAAFQAPGFPILIVDDVNTNLVVASGLMAPYKFSVTTCLSGTEAINLAKTNDFKLLLIDQMMPGLDGFETLKAIRSISEAYSKVPIIAFTANAVAGAREMLLSKGFNDFLSKPIDSRQMSTVLDKWVPMECRLTAEPPKPNIAEKPAENFSSNDLFLSLKGVPDLDFDKIIKTWGDIEDKYENILYSFVKDADNFLSAVKTPAEFAGKSDISDFTIRIHAMKSVTANIGATALSEKAALLEKASTNHDVGFIKNKNLEEFLVRFARLVDNIKIILEQLRDKQDISLKVPIDSQQIAKLRNALQIMDIREADNVLEEIMAQSDNVTKQQLGEISDLLLFSDFEAALALVDNLETSKTDERQIH
ncbi:MAG: response regulator, partial [Deltaproteobacteria bacterium]|nr:response regulator [Deltaproteobacteria bacterium]